MCEISPRSGLAASACRLYEDTIDGEPAAADRPKTVRTGVHAPADPKNEMLSCGQDTYSVIQAK